MNIQKLLKRANIIRVGGNAHRFICRIQGKLRAFTTSEKDFDTNVASLFGNLNFAMTSKATIAASLLGLMALSGVASAAPLPTGGTFVGGTSGTINTNGAGTTMTVTPNQTRSIAQWTAFDVATGHLVRFQLPTSASSILNRVTGGSPSNIMGSITSNGNVYLINPAGIMFGSSAVVNVGSLFASTLPISNTNFLNGTMVFERTSGNPSYVVNKGSITATSGSVSLVGGVAHNEGTITVTPGNSVNLKVGDKVTLVADGLVGARVIVNKELQQAVAGYNTAIINSGTINAPGSLVSLEASLKNNIYSSAVNNSGIILAQGAAIGTDGQVELLAYGNDSNADVTNTGSIDVSGQTGAPNGGKIIIHADDDVNFRGNLSAGAAAGGTRGQITVTAGDDISTTSTVNTGGGHLTVTADGDAAVGQVNTQGGNLSVTAENDVDLSAISTQGGNLTAISTDEDVNANGGTGITTNGGNLTFTADDDVNINTSINTNGGNATLTSNGDSSGDHVDVNGAINTNGGNLTIFSNRDVNVNANMQAGGGNMSLTAWKGDIDVHGNLTARNITLDTATGPGSAGDIHIATGKTVHATGAGASGDLLFDDDAGTSAGLLPGGPSTISTSSPSANAGKVTIKGQLDNDGTIKADGAGATNIKIEYSNGDVNLSNLTLDATGSSPSNGVIDITSDSFSGNNGDLVTSAGAGGPGGISIITHNNRNITGTNANLNAGTNNITLNADGSINLSANFNGDSITATAHTGSIQLNDSVSDLHIAGLTAGTFASLASAQSIYTNGALKALNGGFTINSDKNIVNTGNLQASGDILLTSGSTGFSGSINNQNVIQSTGGKVTLDSRYNVNNTGTVQASGDVVVDAGHHVVHAPGSETVWAGSVNNSGSLLSDNGNVNVKATLDLNNSGSIQANNNVQLSSGEKWTTAPGTAFNGNIDNTGTVKALNGSVTGTATGQIQNQNLISAGQDISLTATQNVVNSIAGKLTAANNITLNGNNIINAGSIDPTTVTLTAVNDLTNSGTVVGDDIIVDAGRHIINDGQLNASGDLNLTVHGNGNISGVGSFNAHDLTLNLENGNATQTGLAEGAALNTNVDNLQIDNAAGASGTVKIQDANDINLRASDLHNGTLEVTATGITQSGTVAANNGILTATNGNIFQSAGQLNGNNVTLKASGDISGSTGALNLDAIDLNVQADGNVFVHDVDGVNLHGLNYAGRHFVLTAKNDLNIYGDVYTGNGVLVLGTDTGNILNNGNLYAGGASSYLTLFTNTSGDITNNGTITTENGGMDIASGYGDIFNTGTMKALNGDINWFAHGGVTGDGNMYNSGEVNALKGKLSLWGGYRIHNQLGGKLLASGTVFAQTSFNEIANNGTIISSAGDVHIVAAGDISNTATIKGDQGITLEADGNITNSSLLEASNQNLTMTTGYGDILNTGTAQANNGQVIGQANNITNNGSIVAGDNINLDAVYTLTNTGGISSNVGSITLSSGGLLTNSGNIWNNLLSNISLTSTGGNILNSGLITSAAGVNLHAAGDLTNTSTISALNGSLTAYAGNDLTNAAGAKLLATDTVSLTAGHDILNAGLIDPINVDLHAGNDITITKTGLVEGDNITAFAGRDINVAGQVGTASTVSTALTATNDVNVTSTETGDCCDPNAPSASDAGRVFGKQVDINAGNNVKVDGYVGDGRADSTTNVTAVNNISGRGLFSGNTVNLTSTNANIGSILHRVRTAANRLSLNTPNGSVYVNQLGSVYVLNSAAANNFALKVFAACGAPAGSKGILTIGGNINGGGVVTLETDNGNIISQGLTSGGNVNIFANGGSIIDGNGDALNLLSTGDSNMFADGTIGSLSNPFDVKVGGKLAVGANGSVGGVSVDINGITGDNTLHHFDGNTPPGAVIFNGQYLFGGGPIKEAIDRGIPYTLQDYRNLTNPLFTTAVNTSGKLLKPNALRNVDAQIINQWQQPEPFDLRLIQLEGQEGEAYELLMNH